MQKLLALFLLASFCVMSITGFSQKKPVAKPKPSPESSAGKGAKVKMGILLRPYDQSVAIRWSAGDFLIWELGKKVGYNIFRRDFDGTNPVGKEIKLNDLPLKPVNFERLQKMMDTSETAAKALFNVIIDTTYDHNIAEAISREQGRNFNFVMGLVMANVHPYVAEISGMLYTDRTVQKGKSYYYEVQLADLSKEPLAKAWAVTTPGQVYKMPQPFEFKARSSKNLAILTWRSDFVGFTYAYFDLYRSLSPDKGFVKVNKLPHVGFTSGESTVPLATYQDTLKDLAKNYYYKVQGVNTFGDQGPQSEVVVVKAKKSLKFTPEITKIFSEDNQSVTLQWSHTSAEKSMIKGFVVQRTLDPLQPYTNITTPALSKTETRFTDTKPLPAAFYRIVTIGIADDSAYSLNYMIQLVDSIPPVSPTKLSYEVDTNNIVKLSWMPNKEKDLLGYRVFKTYIDKDEFKRMTIGHISDTVFTDTIPKSLGYKKVYYTLVAIDTRYNPSPYTPPFEVILPDTKAPSPPKLYFYELKPHAVILKWENSLSIDVQEQSLFRKAEFEYDWKKIVIINKDSLLKISSFIDTSAKPGTTYDYALQATDDRGLKSPYSNIFRLKAIGDQFKPAIKDVKAFLSTSNNMIKIAWQYNELQIKNFVLYRKDEGEKIRILEYLPGTAREYYDKNLKPATQYTYFLVANFKDWQQSKMSDGVVVKY